MSTGDRPHLPLEVEPLPFVRAAVIGRPAPGPVQPVEHAIALEEEPAVRVHLAPPAPPASAPPATSPAPPAGTVPVAPLPATGGRLPVPVALGAVGLAWLLRQRRRVPTA